MLMSTLTRRRILARWYTVGFAPLVICVLLFLELFSHLDPCIFICLDLACGDIEASFFAVARFELLD